MKYRVRIHSSAAEDLRAAYRWVNERAPSIAPRWFNGLFAVIDTLERYPRRAPLAPEAEHFGQEIRHLLYGKRRWKYRILFTIDDDARIVHVFHLRHGSRESSTPRG